MVEVDTLGVLLCQLWEIERIVGVCGVWDVVGIGCLLLVGGGHSGCDLGDGDAFPPPSRPSLTFSLKSGTQRGAVIEAWTPVSMSQKDSTRSSISSGSSDAKSVSPRGGRMYEYGGPRGAVAAADPREDDVVELPPPPPAPAAAAVAAPCESVLLLLLLLAAVALPATAEGACTILLLAAAGG